MKNIRYFLVLIFLAGAFIRGIDMFRPINTSSWRESDIGSISRNFVNEGMNPFYPRIDWRGNTPGYTESEFPLFAWLIALGYQLFGEHDSIGRMIALLFSLASLGLFYKLAAEFLEEHTLVIAALFFTFNPLFVELSTKLKAEIPMFAFYIAAVLYFKRWVDTDSTRTFLIAMAAAALTLLTKLTAAHIGLVFMFLAFQKFGWQAFKQTKLWLFGAATLLPAFLWYTHAKNLWLTYGNSLGISNETHLVGWDFFTNPYFIKGILRAEVWAVWAPVGILIAVLGIVLAIRHRVVAFSLVWLLAVSVFYFIAARTTGDEWATYYHIFSLPVAALLIGLGGGELRRRARESNGLSRLVYAGFALGAFGLIFLYQAKLIRADVLERRIPDQNLVCARELGPAMVKPGLILASGNTCLDDTGYPVAYNASYMFYWLHRRGFNICVEEQSVEKVEDFARQGAVYFIAEKERMEKKPGFEAALRKRFRVVAECKAAVLFEITEEHGK